MTTLEIIEKTKKLIAIPSTADNPEALKEAVEFVASVVAECPNVTIERYTCNGKPSFVAYRGKHRPERFDILLNGHVDVVPGKPALFKPYEKNGRLYGRGALDMKGTVVTLASVFGELVNEVPYNLGLQIVSDEEIGGYDGVSMQIKHGVRADFVVMGEYANQRNTIYNAARGLCWAEIAFSGKSAHGGHLWHGTNAVVKASDFAGAVLRRYPTPDKETWTTTASIASLSTPNETFNKVPDSAVLKIDFRFTQEDPVFRTRESVEEFIHSVDPDARLVNLATFEPAVNVEALNPYVQSMSAALQQTTGKMTKFLGRPGGSDGRHFALAGDDVVEFGLYGGNSHSNNEYVELDSFAEYHKTMRLFLENPLLPAVRQTEITELAERLSGAKQSTYIWYANYGSGLAHENFMRQITGGLQPGSVHEFAGCSDPTPPKRDVFMSLPYNLYFSGKCKRWGGGAHIYIQPVPSPSAHTIARAYLITLEQFEEIIAQQNFKNEPRKLPLEEAMTSGHASIGFEKGHYDELVFCGVKDDVPIFSLTTGRQTDPFAPPTALHTQLMSQGLSENADVREQEAIDYMLGKPGIKGNYGKRDIERLFREAAAVIKGTAEHPEKSITRYLFGKPESHVAATKRPKILITWLHANEELAPRVAHHIHTKRPDLAAHVDYICGNPKAALDHDYIGFTETDLNRSFAASSPSSYEERRATGILEMAKDYDYVLDLHCTVDDGFGNAAILSDAKKDLPAVRTILAAAINSRVIVMPQATAKCSLIGSIDNVVTFEYSAIDCEAHGVPDMISLIENLTGHGTSKRRKRKFFYVEGTIPKAEDPGPDARSFELWKPGGYYPLLLTSGPRSYREDPTKDYCCFYAKRLEEVML